MNARFARCFASSNNIGIASTNHTNYQTFILCMFGWSSSDLPADNSQHPSKSPLPWDKYVLGKKGASVTHKHFRKLRRAQLQPGVGKSQ